MRTWAYLINSSHQLFYVSTVQTFKFNIQLLELFSNTTIIPLHKVSVSNRALKQHLVDFLQVYKFLSPRAHSLVCNFHEE